MKKINKKLPLVLAGLSAVALGTVGFSAWVVGTQKLTADTEGIGVTVETTRHEAIELSVKTVDNALTVTENDDTKVGDMSATGTQDFRTSFTFTIKTTLDYLENHPVTGINFAIAEGSAEKLNIAASNLSITDRDTSKPGAGATAETYSYLDLATTSKAFNLKHTDSTGTPSGATVEGNSYTYVETINIDFKWGKVFDGKAPTEFYNNENIKTKANYSDSSFTYWENVKTEMNKMADAMNQVKDLVLTATVTTSE